jgi:hypothetical protein
VLKKITITFIGATLLSAASYATPQATVDISLLKSEAMSIVKKFGATLKPQLKSALKSGGNFFHVKCPFLLKLVISKNSELLY